MSKYTVRYNVTVCHEIEIEADSTYDARRQVYDVITERDIQNSMSNKFGCNPNDIDIENYEPDVIFDEAGDYAWQY